MVVAMANNGMPLAAPPYPPPPSVPQQANAYYENGRQYHMFRKGKYFFPCDEDEMDRMDCYHRFFAVARHEALHATPFVRNNDEGPRILDLGTGTGIWAIDMADKYLAVGGEVMGVDLVLIQPAEIPGNSSFHQKDIESPWHGMEQDAWDLIHMRMLNGSIANWPDIYSKIYRHLKPNFGWMEQVEIDYIPRCDDNTLPPNSPLIHWTRLLFESMEEAGRSIAYNPATRQMLERAGFVDIQEQKIRVPLNPWPANDPHQKDIGRWYNLGLTQGLHALTVAPLMRIKGWNHEDVVKLCENVKREICSKKHHVYHEMHIWIARRPAAA